MLLLHKVTKCKSGEIVKGSGINLFSNVSWPMKIFILVAGYYTPKFTLLSENFTYVALYALSGNKA